MPKQGGHDVYARKVRFVACVVDACGRFRVAHKRTRTVPVAPDNAKLQSNDAVEAAITRVLTAEVAARDAVAGARSEAVAIAEQARETARRLGLHTDRRIRAVRTAFDAKGTAEVAAMEAQAVALGVPHQLTPVEVARVEQAVAALAAALAGGSS
jgi:hypothetical protein